MVHPRRHAAALIAALCLAVPAPALAQDPTPTPESQPPLSEELPESNGDGGQEQEAEPADTESTEPLAETGLEAGLVALLGLGLLASGGGLRVSLSAHEQR